MDVEEEEEEEEGSSCCCPLFFDMKCLCLSARLSVSPLLSSTVKSFDV